jgi:transketolase
MRRALAEELELIASLDDSLVFLTADLGFGVFDSFKERFPSRYINVGIAEAGMVGLAAGLSKEGFTPVVYSIASFMNSRAYEQIRVLVGYNECKMIIVGAGGGLTYSKSGPTHHALEDLGLALLIPTLNVAAPAGPNELKRVLKQAVVSTQSTYIQIGKFGEKDVDTFYSAVNASTKSENLVISTGGASQIVSEARDLEIGLFDWVHLTYLRPLDTHVIGEAIQGRKKILVIEDSWENAGIYNELVLFLQRNEILITITRLGPPSRFIVENLGLDLMQNQLGYSAEHLISSLKS